MMTRILAIAACLLVADLASAQVPHSFSGEATDASPRMDFDEMFAKAHQMAKPRAGETPSVTAGRLSDALLTSSQDQFNIAANAIQSWSLESPRVALPALVARLDDRRPVKIGVVSLENGPGAFEGVRHYGTAPAEGVAPEVWQVILLSIPSYEPLSTYVKEADRDQRRAWRAWVAAGLPGLEPVARTPPVPAKGLPAQRT